MKTKRKALPEVARVISIFRNVRIERNYPLNASLKQKLADVAAIKTQGWVVLLNASGTLAHAFHPELDDAYVRLRCPKLKNESDRTALFHFQRRLISKFNF